MTIFEFFISEESAKPKRMIWAMGRPKSISRVFLSRKTCRNSFRIKVMSWRILIGFSFSIPCQLIEDFFHIVKAKLLFQVGGAVEGCDDPVHHDGYAVTIFSFVHIVGGDKNGDASVCCMIDEVPELSSGHGVDTAGGV